MDNRAQSIGIAGFFISLVVGGIVYWVVDLVTDPILTRASEATTNAQANQATEWFRTAVEYMPILFMMLAFFGLISYSVWSREVGAR
jgi:TRAP-type C4-dicarboxylate transport system permease large subunit